MTEVLFLLIYYLFLKLVKALILKLSPRAGLVGQKIVHKLLSSSETTHFANLLLSFANKAIPV